MDKLEADNGDRFKVWYTVDRPPEKWSYSKGKEREGRGDWVDS